MCLPLGLSRRRRWPATCQPTGVPTCTSSGQSEGSPRRQELDCSRDPADHASSLDQPKAPESKSPPLSAGCAPGRRGQNARFQRRYPGRMASTAGPLVDGPPSCAVARAAASHMLYARRPAARRAPVPACRTADAAPRSAFWPAPALLLLTAGVGRIQARAAHARSALAW